jgi:hypothetical protein
MKSYIRISLYSAMVLTLFLWGCGPEPTKTASQTAQTPEAKPSTPAPEPTITPAPVAPAPVAPARPAEAPKPKKAPPKPAVTTPPAPPKPVAAAPAPAPAPPPPPPPAPEPTPAPVAAAPAPPPIPVVDTKEVTIPSGKEIAVRMIDAVDSSRNQVGETFHASLDSSILIDNQTVVPRGSDVYVKLKEVTQAGQLKGRSELKLELDRIFVGKKSYTVESNVYETQGDSQGGKAARNAGIGAAIGAAIGAIAGGGKGAAIGAGAGAGGGVAGTVLMKNGQVRIEPETRLVFTLERPLEVTVGPNGNSAEQNNSGPARLNGPRDRDSDPQPGRTGLPGARRPRIR